MISDPKNNESCSLLKAALWYFSRGWCIIPTKGKKAAGPWKKYQTARPDEAELQKLFDRKGITGMAVVLGSASGGLVCRDFDDLEKYQQWAAKFPDLAISLPTVETAWGRHVYFRGPEGFEDYRNGEYRGNQATIACCPPLDIQRGPYTDGLIPFLPGTCRSLTLTRLSCAPLEQRGLMRTKENL